MRKMSKFFYKCYLPPSLTNGGAASGASSNTFWSIGLEMSRNEGIKSMMNGFTASMLREVVYSGIRLGSYEYFKDKYAENHSFSSFRSRNSASTLCPQAVCPEMA
jgi:hypothetical protein